ncbi:MAG: hypothetical protein K2Z81_17520 [Cyanobacteria bacterium]|nr:hypothetical protein [Cyanobacteriota bacterium]
MRNEEAAEAAVKDLAQHNLDENTAAYCAKRLHLKSIQFENEKKIREAILCQRYATELMLSYVKPTVYRALYRLRLGTLYLGNGDYEKASAELGQAWKVFCQNKHEVSLDGFICLIRLGHSFKNQNQLDLAHDAYIRAERMAGSIPGKSSVLKYDLYYSLAQVEYLRGNLEAIRKWARVAIKYSSGDGKVEPQRLLDFAESELARRKRKVQA